MMRMERVHGQGKCAGNKVGTKEQKMKNFSEMGLSAPIQKAVAELGFTAPTPIQSEVIPIINDSRKDLIALAQTGTGKTAAFGLPLIQQVNLEEKSVQAMILSPTRELCMQIAGDLQDFSRHVKGFNVVPVYGGAAIDGQIRQLRRGAQIVVGTPGRMRDLIGRGVLRIDQIRWLVLDEADEMLQMGFREELDAILSTTPADKQTLLFSATMPAEIRRMSGQYMHEPVEISVGTMNAGADDVEHDYYVSHAKHRYQVLKRIADMHPDIYGIVFCRTRRETKEVADKLMNDGYNADALHGDLSQAQRDYVMNRFRKRQLQMLVATDVAARGLDVNDLTHVINYNMPDELEAYIHRSGRTGRAGKKGISISILHTKETGKVRQLEKITKKKFNHARIPGGEEICKKQLFNMVQNMEGVEVADSQIDQFLPEIYQQLEGLSKEDIIKKFVSVEFNRFLAYYKNSADLNVRPASSGREMRSDVPSGAGRKEKRSNRSDLRDDGSARKERAGNSEFVRFYINLGSKNNITPPRLIGLMLDTTNNRELNVGKIDIMKGFSFFEVEARFADLIMQSFSRNIKHEGSKVKVELSNGDGQGERSAAKPEYQGKRARKDASVAGKHSAYTPGKQKKKHRKGVKSRY